MVYNINVNEFRRRVICSRTATLEELSTITQASVSTLRRDLNELEEENALRRVHGGAELQQDLSEELSIFEKSSKNVQEKEKAVQEAGRLCQRQRQEGSGRTAGNAGLQKRNCIPSCQYQAGKDPH